MTKIRLLAGALVVIGGLAMISYTNAVIVTAGTAPDYIDTEGNVFKMGSLTIRSGDDVSITILDRNLGARQTGTTCSMYNTGACGYFFQRGNNYGFGDPLIKTGATKVDTSDYLRANPYISDTFIQGNSDRSITTNNLLWYGAGAHDYMRQGPCPEGYHVPTQTELNTLKTLAGNNGNTASTKFFIPFAGYRYYDASLGSLGYYVLLWSSSPDSSKARDLYLYSNGSANMSNNHRANAISLRCIYDSNATDTSILSFDTRGGQRMQGQTVPTGGTGHTPGYDPKKLGDEFMGWYKDVTCSQLFDFQTDVITSDTTIYAKWKNDPSIVAVNIAALNNGQNTCTLDNYIFSGIFASPSVVFRNISQSMHCIFGDAGSKAVTLELSGNLTDGSGNIIPGGNVRLKNSAWTATPSGIQTGNTAIAEYTGLNQTITLFNKVANKIGEATGAGVDIQIEVPGGTPNGVYNGVLVLSY